MANENTYHNPQQDNQSGTTSTAKMETYIRGIHFPASKKDIQECAKKNNAPRDVIDTFERFEDKEYNSPVDIAKESSRAMR